MGFIQVYNGNLKYVATKDRNDLIMNPYANLRGNSPVVGYEIEATRITVWFKGLSLKPWGIALKFLFLHHENILFPND